MDISIFGKKIDIPDWFKDKITENLQEVSQKYFDRIVDGAVTFNKSPSGYHCQIHIHASRSLSLRGEANSNTVQESFNTALERLQTRLKKYKSRLITRRDHAPPAHEIFEGNQYIIDNKTTPSDPHETLNKTDKILDKKTTHIDTLTIQDAIMVLDLSQRPVLMFKNLENGQINVMYKQGDDTIVLLDPGEMS